MRGGTPPGRRSAISSHTSWTQQYRSARDAADHLLRKNRSLMSGRQYSPLARYDVQDIRASRLDPEGR